MARRWLLLTAALAGSQGEEGNGVCWNAPNWLGLELSYDLCCRDEDGEGEDCFKHLGGLYSREFCCHPPVPDSCDWPGILDRIEGSGVMPPMEMERLREMPVVVQEFCCLFPGPDSSQREHACWEGKAWDRSRTATEELPEPFIQCCFPVLRRRLYSPAEDPAWLQAELDRELAPLEGQRWGTEEMDAFEAAGAGEIGNQPCRLRVRRGHEVALCDFASICRAHPDDKMSENNDCSYVLAVSTALQIIGRIRPLPDMDLFVSTMNQDRKVTSVPVFTRHRPLEPRGLYALLPVEWQLHPRQVRKHLTPVQRVGVRSHWEERIPEMVWRGTNSNCFPSCSIVKATRGDVPMGSCLEGYDCKTPWTWENWLNTPRGRLVFLSQFVQGVDARWTGTSQEVDPTLWSYFEEHNLTAPHLSMTEQTQWRYALNIDGTGNGDRIYWQMLAGFVVLVQASPFISWLVGPVGSEGAALQPFKHYVPVRYDLSDLEARLAWLRSHDEEAQRIAEAGRRFAVQHLSYDALLLYVDRIVRRYATEHLRHDF